MRAVPAKWVETDLQTELLERERQTLLERDPREPAELARPAVAFRRCGSS
jgi:hypothetical protein